MKSTLNAFDPKTTDLLIGKLEKLTETSDTLSDAIASRMAEDGRLYAAQLFATAPYDVSTSGKEYVPKATVKSEGEKGQYTISASGEDVCFVEFGAGVHYNGAEAYPGQRPLGVVGIGQFGKGNGAKDSWWYNEGGEFHETFGTPTTAPMFKTAEQLKQNVVSIVKEVLTGND